MDLPDDIQFLIWKRYFNKYVLNDVIDSAIDRFYRREQFN
jgi:hypothetical protein